MLKDIMVWAKDENVFLSLDVKGMKTFPLVIDMIEKYEMIDQVEVITYSIEAAEMVYRQNQHINLSVTVRNEKELRAMLNTGIPPHLMAAFTGLSLKDASFYEQLSSEGLGVTLGVLGNLDKKAKRQGDHLYNEWKALGIQRFATDRPLAVFEKLK